jgi:hypothetical protein
LFCGIDLSASNATVPTLPKNSCGSSVGPVINSWTFVAGNATVASQANLVINKGFEATPEFKIGQTLTYKSGYSYKQTPTGTNGTAAAASAAFSWTAIDGAATFVMAGAVAALTALAF